MTRLYLLVLLLVLLVACNPAAEPLPTLAPTLIPATEVSPTCAAIVATALSQTSEACDSTERNQACYGNGSIDASLRETDASFERPGERVDLAALESMRLAAMNIDSGVWGVAVLSVQANLPDTLPGQNVTLLVFGNTEFRTVATDDASQAFYFQSGVGQQLKCSEAPPDGLLVQTPAGAVNVEFNLNNVEIQLGSTAFIEAHPEDQMVVNVIEGQAVVTAQNGTETVPAGARTRIALDAAGLAAGQPSAPEPYDAAPLQTLPLRPLERSITVAPPIPIAGSSTFTAIGFQIQDALSQPGEFDEFTFNAQSGQQVYFDGQSEDTNLRWTLTAPDGTVVFETQVLLFDYDTLTLAQSGQYKLTVFGLGDTTGNYEFQVWDVPPAQPVSITMTSAEREPMTGGNIETPGVTDIYTLEAEAGQQIYLDGGGNDTNIRWMLVAPDGTELFRQEVVLFDHDTFTLEQNGTYTLIVDGLADTTGEYQIRVWDVPPAQPVPLTIGSTDSEAMTTGNIETPGVTDVYTFEAEAGQQVYLDGDGNDTNIRWMLVAPDGTELFRQEVVLFDRDTLTLEQSGTYTLTVDGLSDTTGEYGLRLLDVPLARPVPTEIIRGGSQAMTAGTIESPGMIDLYTFEAQSGQRVYFDGQSGNTNLRWTLTAPDGSELFAMQVVQFDYDTFVLEQSGEYTLTVDGLSDATGEYTFRLLNVSVSDPVPVEIVAAGSAQRVSGALEMPGVIDQYTFEAQSGQRVTFAGTADSTGIRWSLNTPDGTRLLDSQVVQFEHDPFTLEQSGVYTLTIDGLGEVTGQYSFQLLEGDG